MRLIVRPDAESVGAWAAEYIVNLVKDFMPCAEKPLLVLGMPTGRSVAGVYAALVIAYKAGRVSFKNVATFNIDEYVDVDEKSPFSKHHFMWEHFFKKVDVRRENVHFLNGNVGADGLDAECARYEAAIKAAGGIDFLFAGTGRDGHFGRNEPGSSLASRTRPKTLNRDTLLALSRRYGMEVSNVPRVALTMGMGTMREAKEVMVIFTGIVKARALECCLEKPVNHMFPVSIIQRHPCAVFVCDEDATDELRVKTVKYFKGLIETAALEVPRRSSVLA